MKVMWRAASAAVLFVAVMMIAGCGDVYRPVAAPLPTVSGNPSGTETEVSLACCLAPQSQNAVGPSPSSVLTSINVSGDSNMGNKVLANLVGTVPAVVPPATFPTPSPVAPTAAPMAFDYLRTSVFTANTSTDSVTQSLLASSTAGFSANTTTISLETGSAPIGVSFQYFGSTYTQDYVVNSGTTTATCPGTGSLGVITQPAVVLKATVCVGPSPVFAWIYKDQSKVFVLDSNGTVDVVNAGNYRVTNTIPVGVAPVKAAQNNTGQYIYVLNQGNASTPSSVTIIDGQAETVVGTITPSTNSLCGSICSSPVIDVAQDTNFNDTSANTQINHLWLLHANGTVSVYDGTVPGQLTWITSLPTLTAAQLQAGATPTNLALMRDGTQAYVGVGGTNQIIAIDTSKLSTGVVTTNATTAVTLDVNVGGVSHKNVYQTINGVALLVEQTTPLVNYVAVSRQGSSAELSKAYATTTTTTTYYYYNPDGTPASPPSVTYPNLYNGTAVVTAAANGSTPINTFETTILAPSQVTYCTPETGQYDGQKNCPAQTPVMVLGRS